MHGIRPGYCSGDSCVFNRKNSLPFQMTTITRTITRPETCNPCRTCLTFTPPGRVIVEMCALFPMLRGSPQQPVEVWLPIRAWLQKASGLNHIDALICVSLNDQLPKRISSEIACAWLLDSSPLNCFSLRLWHANPDDIFSLNTTTILRRSFGLLIQVRRLRFSHRKEKTDRQN